MKKGLALLLSLSLVISMAAPAYADTDGTAAGSSAALPVFYDSRQEASFRPEIDYADAFSASKIMADGENDLYTGDRVLISDRCFETGISLTAAQKAFILSRRADLKEAVWFAMNDDDSLNGSPEERIKKALLDGKQILLGDDYEILGWNDDSELLPESAPADSTAEEGSGQAIPEDITVREPEEDAPISDAGQGSETETSEDTIEDTALVTDESGTNEVSGADPGTVNETGLVSEDPEILLGDPSSAGLSENIDAADTETAGEAEEPSKDTSLPDESVPSDGAAPADDADPSVPAGPEDEITGENEESQESPSENAPSTPVTEIAESDTDESEDESKEDQAVPYTGIWLVRSLATGKDAEIAYEDPSIVSSEVLCLDYAETTETRCLYRTDGGIADGRLTASCGTEDKAGEEAGETVIRPGRWMAQVFTALHTEDLTEISFYTDADLTVFDLHIYLREGSAKEESSDKEKSSDKGASSDNGESSDIAETSDNGDPSGQDGFFDDPRAVREAYDATVTGTVKGCGLHSFVLPESVPLKEGMRFAVAIRFRDDRTSLFCDTPQAVYDDEGREIWSSVPAAESGTQLLSDDTRAWEPLDETNEKSFRIGAVTSYDPASPVMGAAADPIEDGSIYIIRFAANKNYVLDVQGGNVGIRSNIQAHTANGTVAQKWFASKNSDGTWSFVSYMAGRALDVEGNNSGYKTNVQLHTPRFHDSQRWTLIDAGNGSYYIRHTDSGCNLDVSGGTFKNGSNIQIYRANNSDAQKFIFEKVTDKDFGGEYVLTMGKDPRSAITVKGASNDENANLEIQARSMAPQQCFTLTRVSGSYYKVINKQSGKAITINGRAAAGMNVMQASYTGRDLQLWRVVANDDGTYTFFSKALNNICLDVAGGKTDAGTNVRANGYAKGSHQKFFLRPSDKGELDGTYVIRSALYPDRVLDVSGASADAGANIQSHNNNWTEAQKFVLKKVSATSPESVYYITNKNSGKMLSYAGTLGNDANVVQGAADQSDARKWYVTANSDGTYTISPYQNKNLALDIASASIAYKTNVRVHRSNSTVAQKWYLSSQTISSCVLSSGNTVRVEGTVQGEPGDDYKIYLFALEPTNYILGSLTPIGSTNDGASFTVTSGALNMEKNINKEFFTGVKIDGKYHLSSNGMYITNPEKASTRSTARTTPRNKKGMALSSFNDSFITEAIDTLHIKHTAINIPLDAFVTSTGASFSYKGVTYTYANMEGYKSMVRRFNAAGVQVTGIIYATASMGRSSVTSDYITPTGRNAPGSAVLAGMNASEAGGRAKLEAAFAYMASEFSTSDCHIDNWVIGNELDNPVTWNYCGDSLKLDYYATLYAQVYRLAYNAMKRVWGNVRVYDSLDSVWNVNRGTKYYTAKGFQDSFHAVLSGEGAISWGLAYHPYCAPELDPRIWAHREYATTDAKTTPRITLDNIRILAPYVNSSYGSGHPIILSETGINYHCEGRDMPNEQAAAIAYGYYNVEASSGIDNLIIHNENNGEWRLGLYNDAGFTSRRPSYYVFANMDGQSGSAVYTTRNSYGGRTLLQIVGAGKGISNISRWTEVVPGLNMSKFVDPRY